MSDEKKKIVCVEREHATYKTCSSELEHTFGDKISLVHFETGKETLAYLASNRVDLVISSLLQSQIDGIDLLNSSKENNPGLPFVIYTNLEYKDDFFTWGFKPDAYVVRSPDLSGFLETIARLLGIEAI
jgi:DNA-binding NtrC family response regulator